MDSGEYVTKEQLNELKKLLGEALDSQRNFMISDDYVTGIATRVYEKYFGMNTSFMRHHTLDKLMDGLPDNVLASVKRFPEEKEDYGYDFYIKINGKWELIGRNDHPRRVQ